MDTNIIISEKNVMAFVELSQIMSAFTDEHETVVNKENALNTNYICVKIIDY